MLWLGLNTFYLDAWAFGYLCQQSHPGFERDAARSVAAAALQTHAVMVCKSPQRLLGRRLMGLSNY